MTPPTIQDAKDLAYRLRAQGVIVLAFSPATCVTATGRASTKGKPRRGGKGAKS